MGFPIDWTTSPDDSLYPFFPDVSGWTKVIKSTPGSVVSTTSGYYFNPLPAGPTAWDNPEDAIANDGSSCASFTASLPAFQTGHGYNSEALVLSDWGFDIPSDATIQALLVVWNGTFTVDPPTGDGDPTTDSFEMEASGLLVDGEWIYYVDGADGPPYNPTPLGQLLQQYLPAPATADLANFNWSEDPDGNDVEPDPSTGGMISLDFAFWGTPPFDTPNSLSLTAAQINASGFALGLGAVLSPGFNVVPTTAVCNVYAVAMAVYYTEGGSVSGVSGFGSSDFIPSLAGFAGSISGGFGCSPGGSGAPVYDMVVAGQPTGENFVLDDNCSDWFVRARRMDEYGWSEWGFLLISREDIIQSGFLRGQGSVISVLDNQYEPLFTYTAAAAGGGGPNTGEVNITWPSFMLEYADTSLQSITGGAVDSGLTLDSSPAMATNYNVFPKIQPWNGSQIEMDNPSGIPGGFCIPDGSPYLSVAGADTQKDGFVNLAGPPLAFQVIVPAASGSGGGGTGGSGCVVIGEKLYTTTGWVEVEKIKVGDFVQGVDPFTGDVTWNSVFSYKMSEALCLEIVLEDGSHKKVSTSTPCAVKYEDEVRVITASSVTLSHMMFSRKSMGWVKVSEASIIGEQRVAKVSLKPNSWMFVNDVLSHNTRTKG